MAKSKTKKAAALVKRRGCGESAGALELNLKKQTSVTASRIKEGPDEAEKAFSQFLLNALLDLSNAPPPIRDRRPGEPIAECITRALENAALGCEYIARDTPKHATFMWHAGLAIREVSKAVTSMKPSQLARFAPYPRTWKKNAAACHRVLVRHRGTRWEAAVLIAKHLTFFTFYGTTEVFAEMFYETMPTSNKGGLPNLDLGARDKPFDITPRVAVVAALCSVGVPKNQARKFDQVDK
jgi:hypothetical protein